MSITSRCIPLAAAASLWSCSWTGVGAAPHALAAPVGTFYHRTFGAGPELFTDAAGHLVDERRMEPFGAMIDRGDLVARDLNPLDKRTEPATGWSDHGARWLAPDTARWLSPDPPVAGPDVAQMGAPWDLHPYQYVAQNPILYWDPDGREHFETELRVQARELELAHQDKVALIGGAVPGVTRAPVAGGAVTAQSVIDTLDWNDRCTHSCAAFLHPFVAHSMDVRYKEATRIGRKFAIEVLGLRPETIERHTRNNAADAFRHAYFSYRLAQDTNAQTAKQWGDAHEVSVPNPISETSMDLWNNAVGRELAAHGSHDAYGEVLKAYRAGLLITEPVATPSDVQAGDREDSIDKKRQDKYK